MTREIAEKFAKEKHLIFYEIVEEDNKCIIIVYADKSHVFEIRRYEVKE